MTSVPTTQTAARSVLVLAVGGLLVLMALAPLTCVRAEALSSWEGATAYPTNIDDESCVADSGYIYCVAGAPGGGVSATYAVYSASVSAGVVGTWKSTSSYPSRIVGQSCVAYSGYIYCVGGYNFPQYMNAVYFASLSGGFVGTWTISTNAYPINVKGPACVAYSGYIYCVGGWNGTSTSAAYSASLSSGVIGPWKVSTAYPTGIYGQSCVAYLGYVYCVGGWSDLRTANVYSASISNGVIGAWSSTTLFPADIYSQSCLAYSGYVYCVGGNTNAGISGAVYYASLSSGRVGIWTNTNEYPTNINSHSCAIDSDYIYCVGGSVTPGSFIDAVYSAQIVPSQVTNHENGGS